jgi:thymidylate synthase
MHVLCERISAFLSNLVNPVYGYLWRSFGGHYPKTDGVDQIARLINGIETNPNSRRLIVSGWDPRECDNVDLPPCHTLFQFKVEESRALSDGLATAPLLHCQLYQRSADAFLGVPFNISSYALLTHLVAHVCGLEVGEFIYTLGDYHIYQNHLEQVNEVLSREPLPLPRLDIRGDEPRLLGLQGLLAMRYEHLSLSGYESHAKIAAQVAV